MSRPRIGLNCDVDVNKAGAERLVLLWPYVDAVLRAGGLPVLLVPAEERLGEQLAAIDGLLLTGGRDYDPALYGQAPHDATNPLHPRRGAFDYVLARAALERGLPTLGVCGGAQLVNVAWGGTLVQHIPELVPEALTHEKQDSCDSFHAIDVEAGSRLAAIVGSGCLEVNSSHHQAADRVGEGLRVVAKAPDGVVEALEGTGGTFVLAVQWHPERLLERGVHLALFRALVEAAR